MGLLDLLLRRTPRATDPAPAIITTRPASPIAAEDDPQVTGAKRFILEPYFLMIEYRDARGQVTQRRITTRTVVEQDGIRYLQAVCHERNALRTFRLDRIVCFISQDGEVEDAQAWFAEILPISQTVQDARRLVMMASEGTKTPARQAKPAVSTYTALRRELAAPLTLLVASARSDEFLHPREVRRILHFAEDEAVLLRDAGQLPGELEGDMFDKLERTLRRLRPTREDVEAALDGLLALDVKRKRHLAHALAETAVADGTVDDIEQDLIDEFRRIGDRGHGMGWEG